MLSGLLLGQWTLVSSGKRTKREHKIGGPESRYTSHLKDTIEQAQEDDHVVSDPTETTMIESAPSTNGAPSSSRSTPSATVVLISRVHKLEA